MLRIWVYIVLKKMKAQLCFFFLTYSSIPLAVVSVASLQVFFFPEENLDIFSISSTVTGRGLSLVSGRSKTANPDTMATRH